MRYDTPIYFQKITQGKYDKDTGNYGPDTPVEVKKYASVTDSGTETFNIVYGKLKQGSLIVRLQNSYAERFDSIRIGEDNGAKIYKVDAEKLKRRVFIVSEAQ